MLFRNNNTLWENFGHRTEQQATKTARQNFTGHEPCITEPITQQHASQSRMKRRQAVYLHSERNSQQSKVHDPSQNAPLDDRPTTIPSALPPQIIRLWCTGNRHIAVSCGTLRAFTLCECNLGSSSESSTRSNVGGEAHSWRHEHIRQSAAHTRQCDQQVECC